MPAIPRADILARVHALIADGIPIIGGGAGTGISAKSEEAGGIDLIIIYNSGRYRMAGARVGVGVARLWQCQRYRQEHGDRGVAGGETHPGSGGGERHRPLLPDAAVSGGT